MRRWWIVLPVLTLAALLAQLKPEARNLHSVAVNVSPVVLAEPPHVEICPPYCGEPTDTRPPATTTPPPTTATPTTQAPVPSSIPSDEHWFAIGRCEQPGSGLGGVDWTAHDANYGGGLGFATSTWQGFRHPDMPANAWEATPAQQIAVANDLWRLYGASPWGCKSDVP